MEARNFIFYGSNMETLKRLENQPDVRAKLIEAILEYGCYGSYDSSDPVINALMANIEFNINRAQDRYMEAQSNGGKTHGNAKYSHEEMVALRRQGKSNKEIAMIMGCDPKTVQRHLKNVVIEPEEEQVDIGTQNLSFRF